MSSSLPGNLNEIFPLKLRAREAFRFVEEGGAVLAERVRDRQRFSLRPWQHAMMTRFDGVKTFEEIAREVYSISGGGFTSVGLLNFYRWLYQEDLVYCECASVFELAEEEENSPDDGIERPSFAGVKNLTELLRPTKEWQKQLIKLSAIVIFSLSVIRLGYVVAPIFEPPVGRVLAGVEVLFGREERSATIAKSSREVELTPTRELELAGQIEPATSRANLVESSPAIESSSGQGSASFETLPGTTQPVAAEHSAAEVPPARPSIGDTLARLEELRRAMEECRVRRDEFYIQNDEVGYRREVQEMNELAREIGELESDI